MKVGDLVYNVYDTTQDLPQSGVILEFVIADHSKMSQKIKVLTNGSIKNWHVQFCRLVTK